jgi:O-antigen/teichoic acid export membrane protein
MLSPTEFGTYALLFALHAFVSVFISSGMNSTLKRFLPELQENKEKSVFYQVILIQVGLAGLITASIFIFAEDIAIFLNVPSTTWLIQIYSLSLVPATIIGILDTFLSFNSKKFLKFANLLIAALTLSFLIVILTLGLGLTEIIILIVVMSFIACLVKGSYTLFHQGVTQEQLSGVSYRSSEQNFWKHSSSMFIISLGDFLLSYVSAIFFLSVFRGIGEVGYYEFSYGAAYTLLNFIPGFIIGLITHAAIKTYASRGAGGLSSLFRQSVKFTMITVIPTGIVGIILAKDIIITIYNQNYLPALFALQLSILLIASNKWQDAERMKAVTHEKQNILIYGRMFSVLKIPLYILLIPPFGIIGAIVATQFSWYIVLILEYSMLRKHIRLEFPINALGKYLLAGLITGLTIYALKNVISINNIPMLLIFFICSAAVFFVAIRYLHAIEEKDYEMILENNIPHKGLILRVLGYNAN